MSRSPLLDQASKLQKAGRLPEAEQAFRRAVARAPNDGAIRQAFALFLLAKGDLATGQQELAKAAALAPTPETLSNLALLHARQSRFDDADALATQALHLDPAFVPALDVLAFVRLQQHRIAEAAACFAKIVALAPAHRTARFNLARALFDLDRFDEAAAAAAALVAGSPNDAAALELLARTRSRQNRFAEAIVLHDRSAAASGLDPTTDIARNAFAMQHACDWSQRAALHARIVAKLHGPTPPRLHPFMLLSHEAATAKDILAANRAIAAEAASVPTAARPRSQGTRPRIGYLSSDFRDHALAFLAAELFERHDREKFEIFGYAYGPPDASPTRSRLARAMEHFTDLSTLSDEAAANRIAADHIDILVDLTGFGDAARTGIAARRPAPIQASYLGFPATMAAPWIDYLIGDAIVTPPTAQPDYTERLIQLPICYQPRDRTLPRPATRPTRVSCGLPEQGFVFCCFCNSYKITPDVFAIWIRLLHAVPSSILWLLKTNPLAFANLQAEAAKAGIAPNRLIEADFRPHAEHIARQAAADLFLDTQPYGAHTTASDALWAGVPVVTCAGQRFSARVAESVLRHAGFDELIGATLADYEAIALNLARDLPILDALRSRINDACNNGQLFDTGCLAHNLETVYIEMIQRGEKAGVLF